MIDVPSCIRLNSTIQAAGNVVYFHGTQPRGLAGNHSGPVRKDLSLSSCSLLAVNDRYIHIHVVANDISNLTVDQATELFLNVKA